jgi:hypothetical protein
VIQLGTSSILQAMYDANYAYMCIRDPNNAHETHVVTVPEYLSK